MKKYRHLIVPALVSLMTFGILCGTNSRVLAQEAKKEQKIRIVKIDDDGNKTVEERVIEGEDANIEVILEEFTGMEDGESKTADFELDLDEGVIFKKKFVEVENDQTIVRTEQVVKDEKGKYYREEIEEINGEVTRNDRKKMSKAEVEKMLEADKEVKVIHHGGGTVEEEIIEDGEHKMIIIRKDLGEEGGEFDFEWISEDGEDVDVQKLLDQVGVKLDIEIDDEEMTDGDHKVVVRKHFVFVHIDDLEKEDVEILNKAEEGGIRQEETQSLKLNKLEFYPNPSTGKFTLDFELPSDELGAEIRVMNMNGSEIFREIIQPGSPMYHKELDLSGHPGGVYFLSIAQGEERVVKKVVLQ